MIDLTLDAAPQTKWTKLDKKRTLCSTKARGLSKGLKMSFDRQSLNSHIFE